MRVHLKTLGCRLNEAEIESWRRDFAARGFEISDTPENTDLLVINTCAVTAEATRKSRKLIRRTHKSNPLAKLVVTGCYASLDAEQAAAESGVDLIVTNQDKANLAAIASRELDLPTMPAIAMDSPGSHLLQSGRQRAFIKVQDGCRYRCTYCIVTLARGEEQSRSVEEIITEINQLHASGINEAVLTGVHLGGYGSGTGTDLYQLVDRLLKETTLPRLRLGSLEPWDLPENFWDLFKNPRLMPHLHLPIQSGSDSVLRRMARRCKTKEFTTLIAAGRKSVPDLNITTDIIVGFPGETDQEFQETLAFVQQMQFGHIHIFAFSPREGTKAATLSGQLQRQLKQQRSEVLHQAAADSRQVQLSGALHKTHQILVEQKKTSGQAMWHGYTPGYLKIAFTANKPLENKVVNVTATAISAEGDHLLGELAL